MRTAKYTNKKKMESKERFLYLPTAKKGDCLYNGTPIASEKTYNLIGQEGINEIHLILAEMLEWRKKMFGTIKKELYGFNDGIKIVDFQTRTSFKLFDYSKNKDDIKDSLNYDCNNSSLLDENKDSYFILARDYIDNNLSKTAFKNRVNKAIFNKAELLPKPSLKDSLLQAQETFKKYKEIFGEKKAIQLMLK